ncbi:MAG TPA: hypothetical protein VLG46_11555, partial [Anaerolineae bacterium]|nr:hypothetical protein [Anaerolineae bacterium]
NDLRVSDAAVANDMLTGTLRWTAPLNAITYTMRYSNTALTDSNWDSALAMNVPFTAASPGATECFTPTIAYNSGTVYFALKSQSAAGNWSALSNNAFWPRRDVFLPIARR